MNDGPEPTDPPFRGWRRPYSALIEDVKALRGRSRLASGSDPLQRQGSAGDCSPNVKGGPALRPTLPGKSRGLRGLLAALGRVLPLASLAEVGAAAAEQGVCATLTEQVVVTVAAAQGVLAASAVDVVVATGAADGVAALTGRDIVVRVGAADRVDEVEPSTFSTRATRSSSAPSGRGAVTQVDVDRCGRVGERDGVLVGATVDARRHLRPGRASRLRPHR